MQPLLPFLMTPGGARQYVVRVLPGSQSMYKNHAGSFLRPPRNNQLPMLDRCVISCFQANPTGVECNGLAASSGKPAIHM